MAKGGAVHMAVSPSLAQRPGRHLTLGDGRARVGAGWEMNILTFIGHKYSKPLLVVSTFSKAVTKIRVGGGSVRAR